MGTNSVYFQAKFINIYLKKTLFGNKKPKLGKLYLSKLGFRYRFESAKM